jgi:hypothetical protein
MLRPRLHQINTVWRRTGDMPVYTAKYEPRAATIGDPPSESVNTQPSWQQHLLLHGKRNIAKGPALFLFQRKVCTHAWCAQPKWATAEAQDRGSHPTTDDLQGHFFINYSDSERAVNCRTPSPLSLSLLGFVFFCWAGFIFIENFCEVSYAN